MFFTEAIRILELRKGYSDESFKCPYKTDDTFCFGHLKTFNFEKRFWNKVESLECQIIELMFNLSTPKSFQRLNLCKAFNCPHNLSAKAQLFWTTKSS